MACSDEDHGKSMRPGAEDQVWSHRSSNRWPGGREVGWRRVQPAPGTRRQGARVSWLSLNTTWTISSGLASKPAATVFTGLASKPMVMIFSSLASKLVAAVSLGLASKPVVGFLVEPRNQGGEGFPVWASKPAALV
jgi:hypothetical protein